MLGSILLLWNITIKNFNKLIFFVKEKMSYKEAELSLDRDTFSIVKQFLGPNCGKEDLPFLSDIIDYKKKSIFVYYNSIIKKYKWYRINQNIFTSITEDTGNCRQVNVYLGQNQYKSKCWFPYFYYGF